MKKQKANAVRVTQEAYDRISELSRTTFIPVCKLMELAIDDFVDNYKK